MENYEMLRVALVTPKLKVADTTYNAKEIVKCVRQAEKNSPGTILLPELCITSSSCGDLFFQEQLYNASLQALDKILKDTKAIEASIILGTYIRIDSHFYNCAVVIQKGRIRGVVPKRYSVDRWFRATNQNDSSIDLLNHKVPFGQIVFKDVKNDFTFGVEIGDDIDVPLSVALPQVVFNPSATATTVGGDKAIELLIKTRSKREMCSYVYTSAGVHESTTDYVHSGFQVVAEQGDVLFKSKGFERDSTVNFVDIDYGKAKFLRNKRGHIGAEYRQIELNSTEPLSATINEINKNPFMPEYDEDRCETIFSIQAAALAKRLEHTGVKKVVMGVSGGLDSTVTLLVAYETMKLIGKKPKDIIAITMPGFGTTDATYENALKLMKGLGCTVREISIQDAVLSHFKDIGHNPKVKDLTYENAQARERTQILMDIAGDEGGMMLGTGDLSELALGWCTYGGDHLSMYCVNGGVPKTVLPHIVNWFIDNRTGEKKADKELAQTLLNVVDTPISPELLPPDTKGKISQKTEEKVGPYELHDFFIYYTLMYGFTREKVVFLAKYAFKGDYTVKQIEKWIDVFYIRFFSQQYKRSCMPDGPMIFDISLSPRGGLAMPSDASSEIFI